MKRILSLSLAFVLIAALFVPFAIFSNADAVEISNYGGYSTILRVKGDKSLLFSPYLTEVQTAVTGGAALTDFSIDMTFTLLSGNGGTAVFTFPKATAALVKSNGSYYDIFLKGTKGDCGFCPTAGSYYDIYVEVFHSGELFCYGTYQSIQAPAAFANSTFYDPTPVEQPITLPYPDSSNYYYNGIRKKSSGQILFSPYIYELRELIQAGDSYSNYSVKLTFSLVENGEVTATWDPVTAPFLAGNGYYSDIVLQGSGQDCGFCPTAGATYNVYVEVYKGDLWLFYGTYENVPAVAAIADSAYYAPSALPSESFQLSETTAGYAGQIYPSNAFAADGSGVYFTAFMTEFRSAVDGGENVADYTAKLKITKVKNGTTIVTFPVIQDAQILDAGTYFKVVLKDANVSLFCPEEGKTYTVELELLKNGAKKYYGTYTDAAAGNNLSSSSYYEPVTGAVEIASRTGYGGGIRKKSNGAILFSPFVAELRELINNGHALNEYTTLLTPSLVENGVVTATWSPVTISLGASNGQYFDAILQGAGVDCGFCPTAESVYNFYIEIYWQGELFFYGSYDNLTAASAISGSDYYRPSPVPGAPIDYNAAISYTFSNTLRGSAAGFIEVLTDGTGYFEVKWLDAGGDELTATVGTKTLPYAPLATFVRLEGGAEEWTHTVLNFTAIPQGAAKVGLCDSNGTVAASYTLPSAKLLTPAPYNYSYGILSDLHFTQFEAADTAVPRALSFFNDANVTMVTATGDYGVYSEEISYQKLAAAVEASGLLFLGCGGNHEKNSGVTMFDPDGIWRTYMNKGVYDATPIAGVLNVAPNGIDFVYEIPGHTDSVFIFLSQWAWDGHTASQQYLVTPEQTAWLAEQFETYKNRTVFFYFHVYLWDDDGESFDGEGDITGPAGATYGQGYNAWTPDEAILRSLLTEYKNVIFFNGHSHYLFEMQKYNPNLNIYDYEGTTATMVHIPSVTSPRTITDTSTSLSSMTGSASEGVLMFVYDGYEILNGVDFIGERILSEACYIIYNDKTGVVETETSGDVTMTYDKQGQTLRFEGEGAIPQALVTAAASYATVVKNIYVGRGITAIPASAFSGFTALTRAEIKETVTSIGNNAFAGCSALATFVYGGSSADYAAMTIGSGNTALTDAARTYDQYVVTWVVDGVTTTEQYRHYKVPAYNGTPGKTNNEGTEIFEFLGWNDGNTTYATGTALPKIKADVTYTAVFGGTSERYASGVMEGNANIIWEVDRYTGTLTLSGTGAIPTFTNDTYTTRPWQPYAAEITSAVIGNGITTASSFSLAHMPSLTSITCGEDLNTLNADCFSYNSALTTIVFNAPIRSIGQGTVYSSGNIASVTVTNQTAEAFLALAATRPYNDNYSSAQITVQSVGGWDPNATVVGGTLSGNANIAWSLDLVTGVLTFTGSGAMDNYNSSNDTRPWVDYTTQIKKVVINDGITSVGNFAFSSCPALVEVDCGANVTSIGADAFSYDSALTTVVFNGPITSIGQGTVYSSNNLASVTVTGQSKNDFLALAAVHPYNTAYGNATFTVICDACDVDGDGVASISDVTLLLNCLRGKGEAVTSADVNNDGVVNVCDLTYLLDFCEA